MLAFALAAAILIAAAARPQHSVAVPVTDGAIMLANDVSQLDALHRRRPFPPGRRTARGGAIPGPSPDGGSGRAAGVQREADPPAVADDQPLADRERAQTASSQRRTPRSAMRSTPPCIPLTSLPEHGGKRPPSAIVLHLRRRSRPAAAIRSPQPARPPRCTSRSTRSRSAPTTARSPSSGAGGRSTCRCRSAPQQLAQIARLSGGRTFTAANSGGLTPGLRAPRRPARTQARQAGDHRELRRRRPDAAPARQRYVAALVRPARLDD